MSLDEILSELASLGTAQNRKIYARHGVTSPCHGVSHANLDKLARRLRKADIPLLAADLWSTGNHDARGHRIGRVEVDHGETGCRTPDAITYLAKVWAHRERKSARSRR